MASLSARGNECSLHPEVKSLVRCLPNPTLLFDMNGHCVAASETWHSPASDRSLVGLSLSDIFGCAVSGINEQWSSVSAGEERFLLLPPNAESAISFEPKVRIKPWIDVATNQLVGVIVSRIEAAKQTSVEAEKNAWEKNFSSIQRLHYQLVAILSPEGRLIEVNDPPLQLINATRSEIQGMFFWETPWFRDLVDEKNRWPYRLQEAAVAGAPVISRDRFQDEAGNVRLAESSLTAVKDTTGETSYFIIQAIDLTSRGIGEVRNETDDFNYERILRHLLAAVVVIDREGYVTYVNQACVEIVGRVPVLFVDQWCICHKAFTLDGKPLSNEENPIFRAVHEGKRIEGYELIVERPDGSRVYVACYAHPIFDDGGKIVGAINTVIDITLQKETERRLRESEERLAAAVDAGQLGIWEWDSHSKRNFWNKRQYELLGLEVGDGNPLSSSLFYDHVVDNTQSMVAEDYQTALQNANGHFSREIQIRRSDNGVLRWLAGFARIYPQEDGQSYKVVGINYDITEQKELESQLRFVVQQLAESNSRKDEFLATLAHELRNPLAPIRNGLEFIKRTVELPDAVTEVRQIMERQTLQLIRMVNDLLDIARISHGKLVVHLQSTKIEDVLNDAVESCRHLLDDFQIQLAVEIPKESLVVKADPGRLSQVVSNLLNNAIKFSPPRGTVTLSAYSSNSDVCVSVKDDGPGIPIDKQAEIFGIFNQGPPTNSRDKKGLGIGLAIVKSLVTMHGGQVQILSDGLVQGCEFIVKLPKVDTFIHRTDPLVQEIQASHFSKGMRLLVIDDNDAAGRTLAMLLQINGYETRLGTSGEECLKISEDFKPHVILMDIGMPVMDGHEAARRIRKTSWGQNNFLIAVTGWGTDKDREISKAAGFDMHLTKPVDPYELDRILKEHFESKNIEASEWS